MKTAPGLAISLAAATAALAQGEPEVRRAIPVNAESGFENPAWMQRVTPQAPKQEAPPQPAQSVQPAQPTPTEAPGAIRLTPAGVPKDPAQEQLDKANSIYARKMYEFAAMEYERFLSEYPDAPGRDAALFRLGECYRIEKRDGEARRAFERLAEEFQEGDFLGAGAYRLGESLFAEGRFEQALRRFEQAARLASEPQVRLSAKYQSARCLDRLGRSGESAAIYLEVSEAEGKNPYRDHARLARADALAAGGKPGDALEIYESLASGAEHPAMRAEAGVKAGAAAAATGDTDKAQRFFDAALSLGDGNPWRTVAMLGRLRVAAARGQHEAVASTDDDMLARFRGENRAEALALVADANRALGRHARAAALYGTLLREFPASPFAARSRFLRLVALHEAGDKSAPKELQAFLADEPEGPDRDRAALLLAEMLFASENYAEAADRYAAALSGEGLTPPMRRQAEYKRAWCLSKTGDHAGAIEAFTRFLEANPEDELAGAATLQRGIARQQAKDYEAAIADFDAVIARWQGQRERQAAMLQKALTLGQLDRKGEMKEAFTALLEAYPKSEAAAQAEYWIGWAAFEEKDYAGAAPRLARARELDPANFADRAGVRLALCHYYLGDRQSLLAEAERLPEGALPAEVIRWAGLRSAQEGDFQAAERLLANAAPTDYEAQATLAESRLALGNYAQALPAAEAALAAAQEPAPRARALLATAEARRGLKEFDAARAAIEEAMRLQPEGRLNAAGRMAAAEVEFARGDFDAAARAFATVALLYDEPGITPRALQRAADSYRRANNDAEADKALDELRRRFPDASTASLPPTARNNPPLP